MKAQSEHTVESTPEFYELAAVSMDSPAENITKGIMHQLQSVGFLLLTNVSGFNEKDLFQQIQQFFSIPEEEKRKLSKNSFVKENPNCYRGMAPFIDNNVSLKELFDIGLNYDRVSAQEKQYSLHEATPWPSDTEEGKRFKSFMESYYQLMQDLGVKVMRHIAQGYGKPEDCFDSWFNRDSISTLRPIHYLPRSTERIKMGALSQEERKLTAPPHTDSGFLTFLSTLNYPGLQVLIDGEYKSVKPVPNSIVVNIGDMLSRITNHNLKATYHQVLDIGIERYSCPFFFEPHYAAQIPLTILGDEQSKASKESIIYGDWLIDKMKQFAEYKDFQPTKQQK